MKRSKSFSLAKNFTRRKNFLILERNDIIINSNGLVSQWWLSGLLLTWLRIASSRSSWRSTAVDRAMMNRAWWVAATWRQFIRQFYQPYPFCHGVEKRCCVEERSEEPTKVPKSVRRWREMRDLFPCSIRFSIPILPFDLRFGKSWLILALIEHRSRRKEEEEEEEENLKQRCRSLSGNRPSFIDLNITIFSTEEVLSFSSLQLLKLILRGNLFTCN